ncbi:hypothetical protein EV1_019906 [Malus domestica]
MSYVEGNRVELLFKADLGILKWWTPGPVTPLQDDIIVDPVESPEIVDDPFQTIRANLTSADMRESDFSGSTFNGAYMEKAVTYKANFEGRAWWHVPWVGVCTAGEAVEPWVKKMGPNSELRSSSLKIRRKHFLSTIFWYLKYICVLKPSTSFSFFRAIILPICDL